MGVTVVSHSESFSSKLWQSYRGLIAPSMCDPVQQGTCVTFLFLIPSTSSIQTDLLRQQTPFQAKCQLLLWAALYFLSPPPLYPRILSSPDEIPLCSEVLPSLHFLLSCSFIINTVTHQILRSKEGGDHPASLGGRKGRTSYPHWSLGASSQQDKAKKYKLFHSVAGLDVKQAAAIRLKSQWKNWVKSSAVQVEEKEDLNSVSQNSH